MAFKNWKARYCDIKTACLNGSFAEEIHGGFQKMYLSIFLFFLMLCNISLLKASHQGGGGGVVMSGICSKEAVTESDLYVKHWSHTLITLHTPLMVCLFGSIALHLCHH